MKTNIIHQDVTNKEGFETPRHKHPTNPIKKKVNETPKSGSMYHVSFTAINGCKYVTDGCLSDDKADRVLGFLETPRTYKEVRKAFRFSGVGLWLVDGDDIRKVF